MSTKGILSGGRALTQWVQNNAAQGTLIQKVLNGVNTLADNLGASAVGRVPPPPPIAGINVSVGGEFAHFTINHPGTIQQGCRYALEVATNSSYIGAHPIDFGASRTYPPIHLAPLDSNGDAQTFYVRAIAQNPGGDPTEPFEYDSPITTTGTTRLTWAPSTGSGTASNNGSQIGWFMGKIQRRVS